MPKKIRKIMDGKITVMCDSVEYLLKILGIRPEGFTSKELQQPFKRVIIFQGHILKPEGLRFAHRTLFRSINVLVKSGIIEKVDEPGPKGRRGRPPTRYRIPARFWNSQGACEMHRKES